MVYGFFIEKNNYSAFLYCYYHTVIIILLGPNPPRQLRQQEVCQPTGFCEANVRPFQEARRPRFSRTRDRNIPFVAPDNTTLKT